MLLHYLENQKFAILMHVKHVSNVTFYHLSIQQIKEIPNVVKISATINTMQNINILLFVRSLSLTSLKALQLSIVGLSSIKHQHSKKLTRRIEAT